MLREVKRVQAILVIKSVEVEDVHLSAYSFLFLVLYCHTRYLAWKTPQ